MIRLVNIWKSFDQKPILKGVNLHVEPGESMVIFGPGGGGKSVLTKICLGIIPPDKGEVIIDGKQLSTLNDNDLTQLRMKTGTLFQYYALFDSMTVAENVGFYLEHHTDLAPKIIARRVSEELEQVDLAGSETLLPSELSGGMQKRVGIARARIHRPDIIFYDSPTDGLDPVTSDRIIDLIKTLDSDSQSTSLIITNDMNTGFLLGDRMGMLINGEIRTIGTPDDIAASNDPYVYQFIRGLEEGPILDDDTSTTRK